MIEGFACIVVWLGLAGWSFRVESEEMKRDDLAGMFVVCLILAPLTSGAALAERAWPKFNRKATIKAEEPTK